MSPKNKQNGVYLFCSITSRKKITRTIYCGVFNGVGVQNQILALNNQIRDLLRDLDYERYEYGNYRTAAVSEVRRLWNEIRSLRVLLICGTVLSVVLIFSAERERTFLQNALKKVPPALIPYLDAVESFITFLKKVDFEIDHLINSLLSITTLSYVTQLGLISFTICAFYFYFPLGSSNEKLKTLKRIYSYIENSLKLFAKLFLLTSGFVIIFKVLVINNVALIDHQGKIEIAKKLNLVFSNWTVYRNILVSLVVPIPLLIVIHHFQNFKQINRFQLNYPEYSREMFYSSEFLDNHWINESNSIRVAECSQDRPYLIFTSTALMDRLSSE